MKYKHGPFLDTKTINGCLKYFIYAWKGYVRHICSRPNPALDLKKHKSAMKYGGGCIVVAAVIFQCLGSLQSIGQLSVSHNPRANFEKHKVNLM